MAIPLAAIIELLVDIGLNHYLLMLKNEEKEGLMRQFALPLTFRKVSNKIILFSMNLIKLPYL